MNIYVPICRLNDLQSTSRSKMTNLHLHELLNDRLRKNTVSPPGFLLYQNHTSVHNTEALHDNTLKLMKKIKKFFLSGGNPANS